MKAVFVALCEWFHVRIGVDKLRCNFWVLGQIRQPVSVHNCSKISHLNGSDRADAQNEINVGCSICLMVFMVSDGGVGWRRLARGL